MANKISTSSGNLILLSEDYLYNPVSDADYVDGVVIGRQNLTIDGQGHTIDGANQARIFFIYAYNVTLKNINFINGNSSASGGALFIHMALSHIINCNFTDNYASITGGAVYVDGNTNISDCEFKIMPLRKLVEQFTCLVKTVLFQLQDS